MQTSYTEAYCITLKEASVFAKFIVTTDFSSVEEQIDDGRNGLIAKKTSESLAEKIGTVLSSPERYRIESVDRNNEAKESDLDKLYCYIEEKNDGEVKHYCAGI